MFAIFKKEMRAYFISPIGYVYTGIFLAASALICAMTTLQKANYSTKSACKLLLVGLLTAKHGHAEIFFKEVCVQIQHLYSSCFCFLSGSVHSVTLLPEEFS